MIGEQFDLVSALRRWKSVDLLDSIKETSPSSTSTFTPRYSRMVRSEVGLQGVGCVYIKDLEAIDRKVLEAIVARSYAKVTAGTYGLRAREGSHQG